MATEHTTRAPHTITVTVDWSTAEDYHAAVWVEQAITHYAEHLHEARAAGHLTAPLEDLMPERLHVATSDGSYAGTVDCADCGAAPCSYCGETQVPCHAGRCVVCCHCERARVDREARCAEAAAWGAAEDARKAAAAAAARCAAPGGIGVSCDRPSGHAGPHGDRHETWTAEQAERAERRRPLHPDAPPVPPGLRPRAGVEYGCGVATCSGCYEPAGGGAAVDLASPAAALQRRAAALVALAGTVDLSTRKACSACGGALRPAERLDGPALPGECSCWQAVSAGAAARMEAAAALPQDRRCGWCGRRDHTHDPAHGETCPDYPCRTRLHP